MTKLIKKYVLTFPTAAIGIACLASSLLYVEFTGLGGPRNPSESTKEYEITLSNIKLDQVSQMKSKNDVFLRLRFDENTALDIGRGQKWDLKQGQQVLVNQKIPLEPRFIKGDETKFTLELLHEQSVWGVTKADVTLLRCNTVAKELSAYNRAYQCFIPGEKAPILTYRLAEKGVPVPSAEGEPQVASF